jgi:hypothetical protein
MESNLKTNKWIAGAGTSVACLVVVALMKVGAMSGSGGPAKLSPRAQAELANAVSAANQASAASYAQEADAWRRYLASARSTQRLRDFVGELLSYEQKARHTLTYFNAGPSDEQRALSLFRQHVLDEQKLATEMQSAVDAYERMLFEDDRTVFAAAGLSSEAWANRVQSAKPTAAAWSQAVRPVIARAVAEMRKDVIRLGGTWAAGEVAGRGVKKIARDAGWDRSEEGSWGDVISGFFITATAEAVLDHATDPTDSIVASMSQDMARVERELLDGEHGLFSVMKRMKSAHESARNSVLITVQER